MKRSFRTLLGVLFFSPMLMMGACKEDVNLPADAEAATEPRAVYATRAITFDRANGIYTNAQAVTDFGNMTTGWNESRAYTTGNVCQIKGLKDALSASGGMIAKYDVEDGSEYSTTFKVKFHADFEWCTGGKLGPGFFIGDQAAGGGGGLDGQGGRPARLSWLQRKRSGLAASTVFQPLPSCCSAPGF
jgi:hypothetical protein